MAATKIFNIYPERPGELKIIAKANAGTLTIAEGKTFLGTDNSVSFASDLAVGDLVVPYEVNSAGDIVVSKRAYTSEQPIGEVTSIPKLAGVEPAVGTHTYGNYDYEVEILIYGQRIRTRTVYTAQSNNLTAGQFLKACAQSGFANELEESATETSYIGLDAITASGSGVTHNDIAVLEGFELQTTDAS
jgi:hypothetical protein